MQPGTLVGRYRLELEVPGARSGTTRAWIGRLVVKKDVREPHVAIRLARADERSDVRRMRAEFEARLMIRDKRHVIDVLDLFDWEDAEDGARWVCLVSEQAAAGRTLLDLVRDGPAGGGGDALEIPLAVDLFRQGCLGLRTIHGAGLVHGDLRPENLFVRQVEGGGLHLGVGGLGFATSYRAPADSGDALDAPTSFGDPMHSAPEVWTGETNPRSDAYSLGFAFYRLFAGDAAFSAQFEARAPAADNTDPEGRWRRWHTDPATRLRPLHELAGACPGEVAQLVDGLVCKDIAARMAVDDVLERLQALGPQVRHSRPSAAPTATTPAHGGLQFEPFEQSEPFKPLDAPAAPRHPATVTTVADRPAETAAAVPGVLVVRHGDRSSLAGQVQTFAGATVRIGRKADNDVRFHAERDLLVSAHHAEAFVHAGRVFVRDAGSANGTWIGAVQVRGDVELRAEESVRLGREGPELRITYESQPRHTAYDAGAGGAPSRAGTLPATVRTVPVTVPVPSARRVRRPVVVVGVTLLMVIGAAIAALAWQLVTADGAEDPPGDPQAPEAPPR